MRLLALADDLTGALEVGAKFAGFGAVVATQPAVPCPPSAVLVIDTETRHLDPVSAERRLLEILERTRDSIPQFLFKKTDSTLRGNIAAELRAIAGAYPDHTIVFAPAYPEMGRTVRGGCVYVDGVRLEATSFARDALNPVRCGNAGALAAVRGRAVVVHESVPSRVTAGAVHVFDGQTEADVAAVAALIGETDAPLILCGTGSLAGHLSRVLAPPQVHRMPSFAPFRSCLVVNGSRHETSRAQVEAAVAAGWPAATAPEILASGLPSPWTILTLPPDDSISPAEFAANSGAAVRKIVAKCGCDALVVFGGDTAFAVAEALGWRAFECAGEVLPGVPVSLAGSVRVITKAGGFGAADLLIQLRDSVMRNECCSE